MVFVSSYYDIVEKQHVFCVIWFANMTKQVKYDK